METLLFGSLRLPKMIASAGQACWQATLNESVGSVMSPEPAPLLFDLRSWAIFASSMRWTQ